MGPSRAQRAEKCAKSRSKRKLERDALRAINHRSGMALGQVAAGKEVPAVVGTTPKRVRFEEPPVRVSSSEPRGTRFPRDSYYYASHVGLSRAVTPLFLTPVEVLANNTSFGWEGYSLVGRGEPLFAVYFDDDPRLPPLPALALHAEDTARKAARLSTEAREKEDRKLARLVTRYYRNLELLQFMRCVWDALMLGFQEIRLSDRCAKRVGLHGPLLNSRCARAANRFKAELVMQPLKTASRLKALASGLRGWFFGRKRPEDPLVRCVTAKWQGLIMSYIGRALPAPPADESLLDGLRSRLTSEPVPENPAWRPWLKAYLDRMTPTEPVALTTAPSGHAGLGYPRNQGGHAAAVTDLVVLGMAMRLKDGPHPAPQLPPVRFAFDPVDYGMAPESQRGTFVGARTMAEPERPEDIPYGALLRQAGLSGAYQEDLRRGVAAVLDSIGIVPVLPIVAPEKGLKTRIPTATLTAVNLVQQLFRRVADSYLIRDCRISGTMGGTLRPRLSGEGPYFSADMSSATDFHPFWLTRSLYEELSSRDVRLAPYRKWVPLLFGPRAVLQPWGKGGSMYLNTGGTIDAPRSPVGARPAPDWDLRRRTTRGIYPLVMTTEVQDWATSFLGWVAETTDPRNGYVSTVGAMMGDPTSFPLMPLVSAFAAELAGHSKTEGKLCGDDALFGRFAGKAHLWKQNARSCGGSVNDGKTEEHELHGLFCEVAHVSGKPIGTTILSNWVAPPGGSKGSVTWATQPMTCVQQNVSQGRNRKRGLWVYSPHFQTQRLAYFLGLPVGAPEELGGLNHPLFPKGPIDVGLRLRWQTYLSGLDSFQLSYGTGLSLLPTAHQLMRTKAADAARDVVMERRNAIVHGYAEEGEKPLMTTSPTNPRGGRLLTVSEFADEMSSPLVTWELYFRDPVRSADVPSVRKAASTFRSKVSSSAPISGTLANVLREISRKKAVYVTGEAQAIARSNKTELKYGLEGVPARKTRKNHWIPGREAWE